MQLKALVRKLLLGLVVCFVALPVSYIVTVFTFPFWRWLDTATGIESFGHSGPADWCFWLVYVLLLLGIAFFAWWLGAHKNDS